LSHNDGERPNQSAAKPYEQQRQYRPARIRERSLVYEPKAKANDKAYNSALRNLPDKQFDPWRGVR